MQKKPIKLYKFLHSIGLAAFVKGLSVFIMFVMNLIVARSLDLNEAGLFFLGFTTLILLSAVGRMGFEQTLISHIAIFSESNTFS